LQKISNRLCSLLLPTELTHIFRRSKAEGISGLIAGAEGEEHDNPLPQSGAASDGRGVADRQGENVPVCEHRAKVEQRRGCSSRPKSPRGNAVQAIKTPAAPRIPAMIKALRQPSSVPTRPNRKDSDAPMVNELVYHAATRARIAGATPCVSARSPG